MRLRPGHPLYAAHMLRFVAQCRRKTKDKPKRDPRAFRMFEFAGVYARLRAEVNKQIRRPAGPPLK